MDIVKKDGLGVRQYIATWRQTNVRMVAENFYNFLQITKVSKIYGPEHQTPKTILNPSHSNCSHTLQQSTHPPNKWRHPTTLHTRKTRIYNFTSEKMLWLHGNQELSPATDWLWMVNKWRFTRDLNTGLEIPVNGISCCCK